MSKLFSRIGKILPLQGNPLQRQLSRMAAARDAGVAGKVEKYNRALAEGDPEGIQRYRSELEAYLALVGDPAAALQKLQITAEIPEATREWQVVPQEAGREGVPTYWISSATLAQAFGLLTRSLAGAHEEPEWMLAVTGLRRGNLRTLETLFEVAMDTQSAARASFDMDAFTRVGITLHKHGQALHGIFHSHRFNGPPNPSAVDWRLQDRLDEGGYPCIQAVFSEDAHVRFFARKPFRVEVYGKGVKALDEQQQLYRIVYQGTLPDPGHVDRAGGNGQSDALRSLPAHSRG